MKLLIESSTSFAVVALMDASKTTIKMVEGHNSHSKTLLSVVDHVLQEAGVQLDSLTAIIVGEGPGSYTGARIAVTIAKMFSLQLNIPLFAFDSLSLFATGSSLIAVQIPLKRSTILGGVYDMSQASIIHPARYYDEAKWLTLTQDIPVITPHQTSLQLDQLVLREIKDVNHFQPNYAREWQPT